MIPARFPKTTPFLVACLALGALALPVAGLAQEAADSSLARLAPTSSPPWNPPRPVAGAEPWEAVARLPGQIASIPFSLVGQGVRGGLIFTEDNSVVPKIAAHVSVLLAYGVIAGPASLGDRTGWGGELGINPPFFRNLEAAVSGSTLGYNRERVAIVTPQGKAEFQSDWRPREPFFGVGLGSVREDASDFALRSQSARIELRYPFARKVARPHEVLEDPAASTETHAPPRHLLRVWAGPRDVILRDGREHTAGRLPLTSRFPALASDQLDTHVEHFVYGAQASYDRRSGRPHWWKGWRAATTVERYDLPLRAFALRSASTPSATFTRWTYEGEGGWSFWRDPRTVRLYARVEDRVGADDGGVFLISDLAALGGHEGLSGFEPGRFRDADLVLGRVTYIFPIARYLETDLHAEAGSVTGALEDARMADAKTSFGFALRVRNSFAPLASIGVDWSREKVRLGFTLGGIE